MMRKREREEEEQKNKISILIDRLKELLDIFFDRYLLNDDDWKKIKGINKYP